MGWGCFLRDMTNSERLRLPFHIHIFLELAIAICAVDVVVL